MAQLIAADAGVTLDGVPRPTRARPRERSSGGLATLVVLLILFAVFRSLFRGRRRRGGRGDGLAPFIIGSMLGRGFGGRGYGGFGGGGFGGSFGGGGGGFGGFGGGRFGGGGAGGSW
jgi:uncharacterized protein